MTFVFQEVAHAGSAGEYELRYILNDLRLGLGSHSSKPFCETDLA